MVPGSSQAVVLPKFDMHVHTSILTSGELNDAVNEYCIPRNLHPRLTSPALTMNKLPFRYIGLYIKQLEQGGYEFLSLPIFLFLDINPTVSLFRVFYKLCKKGHWFSFESKTGGRSKKCFKEITSSLKDLRDDFPMHYNKSDATRLAEFVVPLRLPPRHMLYMCCLTTACRHPELAYNIKDRDRNGNEILFSSPQLRCSSLPSFSFAMIMMDAFLKLPVWTGTVKNLEKLNPKIVAAREKNEAKALAKLQAKRAGKGASEAPRNKIKNEEEPTTAATVGSTGGDTNVEKEVVDLSGNTRAPTPSSTTVHSSLHLEHTASDAHSFHSSHH
ncbi:hypothetical protein Tco_0282095 [Tanacetum coccineum]